MRPFGFTALVLVLLLGGCQSSRPNLTKQTFEITALHGTDISLLDYSVENEVIDLTWESVPTTGQFIRIHLPPGTQEYQPTWENSGGFIEAVIPGDGFLDVGIVALDGYGGWPAKLRIEPSSPRKTTSDPPRGENNKVDFIVAYQLDAGAPSPNSVRLEWAELNRGDYNFDGEVSIADLTPIAVNFGATYPTGSATEREQTVYWVDGDRNGEVNLADITTIASNYQATVDGYNIYNGLGNPTKINRTDAQARNTNGLNLPPLYSVPLTGLATDSWQVAPLEKNVIGTLSTVEPIVVEEFNAVGSLVITGLELYQFESGTNGLLDSGHSLMRLLDPNEDIDSIEIGDIIEGSNGSFALANIPLDTQLALEITFAPVLNLLTGVAFSEDPVDNQALSLASPVVVRSLFSIPSDNPNYGIQPRIHLSPNPQQGFNIDLATNTVVAFDVATKTMVAAPEQYDVHFDYFNFRVSTKRVNVDDYQYSPLLRDTNRDLISDAKVQEIADVNEYPVENTSHMLYRGRVSSYREAEGTITLEDAWVFDASRPGGGYEAPDGPIEINCTEYTAFLDEVSPQFFEPAGIFQNEVVIACTVLSDEGFGGKPTKWWATSITRTKLLPPI